MLILSWSDFGTCLKDSKAKYTILSSPYDSLFISHHHCQISFMLTIRSRSTLASFCQPFEDAEWFKIVGETQGQTQDQLVLQRRCCCISFEKSWEVYLGIGFLYGIHKGLTSNRTCLCWKKPPQPKWCHCLRASFIWLTHSFVAVSYFTCFFVSAVVFSLRIWVSIVPSPLKWKRPLSSEKYHTTVVMQNGRSMHRDRKSVV